MNPKFRITNRDGKKSLWVNDRNIWDLDPKELTNAVEHAIISAYYRGISDMRNEFNKIKISKDYESLFKEE